MQIEITSANNPTSPYIPIAGDTDLSLDSLHNPSLKATLNNTLVVAIDRSLDALQRHRFDLLPPVIGSLDLETGGFATRRTVNMLCTYQRLMQDDEHADVRERLCAAFHPKESWVAGQRCITTPALLLIQAILYSHAEWFRDQVHEAHSALRAYNELIQQDFAPEDAQFVALIIAHQTLLRAAWYDGTDQDPCEVLPFYRIKSVPASVQFPIVTKENYTTDMRKVDRLVGQALAKTLFSNASYEDGISNSGSLQAAGLIPWIRRERGASLVLQSLCLFNRHSQRQLPSFDGIKRIALPFLDHLLAQGKIKGLPEINEVGLAFLQYWRYVHEARLREKNLTAEAGNTTNQDDKGTVDLFDKVKEKIEVHFSDGGKLGNFTYHFQRVSSQRVWKSPDISIDNSENPHIWDPDLDKKKSGSNDLDHIQNAILHSVGTIFWHTLESREYLGRSMGLSGTEIPSIINEWINDTNKLEDTLQEITLSVHKTHFFDRKNYLPSPIVGHILRQMRDVKPNDFSPLHVVTKISECNALAREETSVIWLPKFNFVDPQNSPKDTGQNSSEETEPNTFEMPEKGDDIWHPNNHENGAMLVARYVASFIIAKAAGRSPCRIWLDFFDGKTRKDWGELIQKALDANGGLMFETFITQLNCIPMRIAGHDFEASHSQLFGPDSSKYDKRAEPKEQHKNKQILAIDIGGTNTKFQVFSIANLENCQSISETWDPIDTVELGEEGTKALKNIKEIPLEQSLHIRFKAILDNITEKIPKKTQFWQNCIAVAIDLPAPVATNEGVPLAPSGGLAKLFDLPSEICKANPLDFHKLDIKNWVSEYWQEKTQSTSDNLIVKVLNDGVADIRDSDDVIRGSNPEGIVAIVKLGTGLATAVYRNGTLEEFSNELAKALFNIWPEKLDRWKDKNEENEKSLNCRFPEEALSHYCSGQFISKVNLSDPSDSPHAVFTKKVPNSNFDLGKDIVGKLLKILLSPKDEPRNLNDSIDKRAEFHRKNAKKWDEQFGSVQIDAKLEELLNITRSRYAEQEKHKVKRELERDLASRSDPGSKKSKLDFSTLASLDPKNQIQWSELKNELKLKYEKHLYALRFAYVMGRWLADGIAAIVAALDANEVRLAGGPLSGETGLFVTTAACIALEEVYGFDLDVQYAENALEHSAWGINQAVASHGTHEVRPLRLVYPPIDSSTGGPRGAAKAALDTWYNRQKAKELEMYRDKVEEMNGSFSVSTLKDAISESALSESSEYATDDEVASMLVNDAAALRITREDNGDFRKVN